MKNITSEAKTIETFDTSDTCTVERFGDNEDIIVPAKRASLQEGVYSTVARWKDKDGNKLFAEYRNGKRYSQSWRG